MAGGRLATEVAADPTLDMLVTEYDVVGRAVTVDLVLSVDRRDPGAGAANDGVWAAVPSMENEPGRYEPPPVALNSW